MVEVLGGREEQFSNRGRGCEEKVVWYEQRGLDRQKQPMDHSPPLALPCVESAQPGRGGTSMLPVFSLEGIYHE